LGDRLLTVAEVAAFLRVSERTVYRLLEAGVLPGFKVGARWRVREDKLWAFLERKEGASFSEAHPAGGSGQAEAAGGEGIASH